MKVVILAGGLGTRLAEETELKPKPMVEIGGRPILWHIMMHYSAHQFNEFIIALGYKGEVIKKFMMEYNNINSNMTVKPQSGQVLYHNGHKFDWTVDLIDTGLTTNTGGRIKRVQPYIGDQRFFLTWGDGVSDLNLRDLLAFHKSHGRLCTVTAVRPPARFGHMEFDGDQVVNFSEKPQASEGWINGAFFVCEPGVFDYIDGDHIQWEKEPMEQLAADGQLMAYKYEGFWQCMDTVRDKKRLEELWSTGAPPWRVWKD